VSERAIQADLQALAGRLLHRGANTDSERAAAEYIRDRFQEYAPDVEIDDFYSLDNPWLLFCSYYAEFTVVALIAIWWPRIALCYGAAVLLVYLAEFMGYPLMGRFAPQYETQNVIARFLAARPARVFVVMAHYDSPRVGQLDESRIGPWLPATHAVAIFLMSVVLVTCATDVLGVFASAITHYDLIVRWAAVGVLLLLAAAQTYNILTGEFGRGANDNASGAAALLEVGRRLAQSPIPGVDLHLVATGSHHTWMHGARHFITIHKFDPHNTFFLNLDAVGCGAPTYTTGEGLLHVFPCASEMLEAAQAVADCGERVAQPPSAVDLSPHDQVTQPRAAVPHCPAAAGVRLRVACSDALAALIRGYKAMTITAAPPPEHGSKARPGNDTLTTVDYQHVLQAAEYAEAVLRRLAEKEKE
jgi:hypothetical protein